MSDAKIPGKMNLEKMTNNPFFNFSKPYLDYIGKGKLFNIVYFVMAVVSLLIPFGVLITVINTVRGTGILQWADTGNKVKIIFVIIFSWLVIAFACWIGFQLWWDRRKKITNLGASEFIATPMFSEIFLTFGEWLGTLIAIIGAGVGLIAFIFFGKDSGEILYYIDLGFVGQFGPMAILIGPIIGFFIIIISRFLAEQLKLLASLVNNIRIIAVLLKK